MIFLLFFEQVEQQEGKFIIDWSITQTTLEDVFLHLTALNKHQVRQFVPRSPMVTQPVFTKRVNENTNT